VNGQAIPDSQFAIEFIKKKFGVDSNINLSEDDKAVARAFLKLTEENLYWYVTVLITNFRHVVKVSVQSYCIVACQIKSAG
jgi:hypothetical protein